jgi:uncharacterized protein
MSGDDQLAGLLAAYPWFEHAEGIKFAEIEKNSARSVGHWLFSGGAVSAFHRVTNNDEIWAIHSGALILHVVAPNGEYSSVRLGTHPQLGESVTASVSKGHWQAAELASGANFAFGTNVCAPPFEYAHHEMGRRSDLIALFPQHAALFDRLALE